MTTATMLAWTYVLIAGVTVLAIALALLTPREDKGRVSDGWRRRNS